MRQQEYETFSVYFNLDHGAGKIRGIYLDGNEAARPLFSKWLQPFADLGAETVTLANSGGTDHTSFEAINLPGFSFIQDPLDYWTRTHHSNADVLDRVPPAPARRPEGPQTRHQPRPQAPGLGAKGPAGRGAENHPGSFSRSVEEVGWVERAQRAKPTIRHRWWASLAALAQPTLL